MSSIRPIRVNADTYQLRVGARVVGLAQRDRRAALPGRLKSLDTLWVPCHPDGRRLVNANSHETPQQVAANFREALLVDLAAMSDAAAAAQLAQLAQVPPIPNEALMLMRILVGPLNGERIGKLDAGRIIRHIAEALGMEVGAVGSRLAEHHRDNQARYQNPCW